MLKYVAAAAALKAFSCGAPARRLYRALGNFAGTRMKQRSTLPSHYFDRIKRKADLCREFGILKDGDTVLELGTGWVHWEAITLKLFWDIKAVLYDVWDNRQFPALKSFLRQVDTAFKEGYRIEGVDMARARRQVGAILETASFEELYRLLGFRYVVGPSGTLDTLGDERFRLVVSAGVFEHIYRAILSRFVARWSQLLAPGGFALHTINIKDHLYQYDLSVCPKQYLGFSEKVWKRFFENDVQYINRVQRCEWLEIFAHAGLVLREEQSVYVDLGRLEVKAPYTQMDAKDLRCGQLEVVLEKPDVASPGCND
jgi:cyclopropane fatty-acyl-phospholipid synthase-like methyltransferase